MIKIHFQGGVQSLLRLAVGVVLGVACLSGAISVSTAHAAGGEAEYSLLPVSYTPSVPATKSYFIFDMHPGTTLKSSFRITNSGTAIGTATLSPVDATTGQTSGTVFSSRSTTPHKVGSWISLDMQSVTLAPGESRVIGFRVAVPGDAGPGQHVGGIVATSPIHQMAGNTTPLHINVQQLSGIAVQVNLPGPIIEQLHASSIQAGGANGYQTISIALRNAGNVMLKPSGSLQVLDAQNRPLQTLPLKLDTFLPDTAISYPVYLQKQMLNAGQYHAILTLNYGDHQVLNYATRFTITQQQVNKVLQPGGPFQSPGAGLFGNMPWWQLGLIGLLALCGAAFLGQNIYRLALAVRGKSRAKR